MTHAQRLAGACLCAGLLASAAATAAPLDALLDAAPRPARLELEAAYDLANAKVDFLHIRAPTTTTAGTTPGDYAGGHLRVQWGLLPTVDLEGSVWQRKIDYRSFTADIQSWQLAAQWRALEASGWQPHLGLRLGVWGNASNELRRMTSVTVQGTKFTSARVTEPRDLQVQLDAVATWPLNRRWSVSAMAGVVASQTDFDTVDATTEQGGCTYQVDFTPTHVIAVCNTPSLYTRVSVPNAVYGVDVNTEARYASTMLHGGLGLRWQGQRWHGHLGYKFTAIQRENVDRIIAARGGIPYRRNHVLMGELGYRATAHLVPFVRGQLMSNQFNGESPMSYNTLTANRFGKRYGLLMLGVNARY